MNSVTGDATFSNDEGIEISWVLPVYRTGQFLPELTLRIKNVCDELTLRYEILAVVDGCEDYLQHAESYTPTTNTLNVIVLDENGGQDAAIVEGLRHAKGDFAIMMDADLQDTPEQAARLLSLRRSQVDVVFANRSGIYQRRSRMLTSYLYRTLFSKISGLPAGACLFALLNRQMIDTMVANAGANTWLLALLAKHGNHYASVTVARELRKSGVSSYSWFQRIRRGLGSIIQLIRIIHLSN